MNDEQSQQRITGLEQTVQSLTQRVYRLEQAVTELSVDALRATPPRPAQTPTPAVTPAPAPVATPAPARAVTAPAPVVYPLERAADAIASLEDRSARGKVVVTLRS